ncbi:MAG: GDSL-type esterase/lipase family protein [Bacteroides sp.]
MINNLSHRLVKALMLMCWLSCSFVSAQQKLPPRLKAIRPMPIIQSIPEYHSIGQPILFSVKLPASFKRTLPNIIDGAQNLRAFFDKLRDKQQPIRIVHIGDSHVRGYAFPLTIRHHFERDFGHEATYPDTITYTTPVGLARETGLPGVVYHAIGINGATCSNFANVLQVQEIANLKPDLLILSFGTNESGRGFQSAAHQQRLAHFISMLQNSCPRVNILFTTPPGSYLRRSKRVNPYTALVAKSINDFAQSNDMATWNLYRIMGGNQQACNNWSAGAYMRPDHIHYTVEGYQLQGNLLYEALIKAYNDYVAN